MLQDFLFEGKSSKNLTIRHVPALLINSCGTASEAAQVREANGWVNVNVHFYIPPFFSHWVIREGKQGGFSKCLLSLRQFSRMSRLNRRIHGSALEHMKQMNNLVIGC